MSKDLEILNNGDVISVLNYIQEIFTSGNTLRIQQLFTEYEGYIKTQTRSVTISEICTQGIECEVLKQVILQNQFN